MAHPLIPLERVRYSILEGKKALEVIHQRHLDSPNGRRDIDPYEIVSSAEIAVDVLTGCRVDVDIYKRRYVWEVNLFEASPFAAQQVANVFNIENELPFMTFDGAG